MSAKEKISPAFDPFMAESRRNDKRDAIVIYQTPVPKAPPVSGRSREPQRRLSYLKEVAALQRSVEERLLRGYKKASSESLRKGDELEVSAIGSSALPIATVEVTRKTLRALAEQPEVVAIMPNQQIQLIQPKQMHLEELSKRETSKGMTWGLEDCLLYTSPSPRDSCIHLV